ncbi:lipopolysaccharide biosynthesis protein [Granulicella cerasi]|uniref:Lipopolysaccharide biosynthesis protein n=1 Tax=Granulicella cerasi TaxID=741063 RepID=A0ABW1Z5N1_9BACT|nr:lipopolysaccharide biosynthesis protein [Granulicella cerasi]
MLSFLSSSVSRFASTGIQFVQVPVFLHFWSVGLYGEWLILNSLPTYLAFSSTGFGTVAGNKMAMLYASGDEEGSLRVFQSCWWLIVAVCGIVTMAIAGALLFISPHHWLNLRDLSDHDARWILFMLSLCILVGQLEQLLQSAYRAVGRYPFGTLIKSLLSIAAFACTMISVAARRGPMMTAFAYVLANLVGTLVLIIMVMRDLKWVKFGWDHASRKEIRELAGPAIAYMAFPVGVALNLQGTLLAVSYALGPVAVVVFSTARTFSRGALQMVQMVNSTFEPELALSFGSGKIETTRTLHRRSCQLALGVCTVIVAGCLLVGPYVVTKWTGHHIPPDRTLLAILLAGVMVYSLWATSSTLISSVNRHQGMAAVYLSATAATCLACFWLAKHIGLHGAAAGLLLAEVCMMIYVVPASLRIAQDTFWEFAASLLSYPASLRPSALLANVRARRNAQTN